MELALKITSKIRAGERFTVYVVIPMCPEGVPTTASVQEILYFQAQTMKMMYRVIAQELKAMNIENAKLQDYLNFYCLGNRGEPSTNGSPDSDKSSDRSAAVYRYRTSLRAEHLGVVDEHFKDRSSPDCVRLLNQIAERDSHQKR